MNKIQPIPTEPYRNISPYMKALNVMVRSAQAVARRDRAITTAAEQARLYIGSEPNKIAQAAYTEIAAKGSVSEILTAAKVSAWFRDHYTGAISWAEKKLQNQELQRSIK